jgi:hypothetical protein
VCVCVRERESVCVCVCVCAHVCFKGYWGLNTGTLQMPGKCPATVCVFEERGSIFTSFLVSTHLHSIKKMLFLLVCLSFCFGGTGVGTQGLRCARVDALPLGPLC